MYPPDYTPPANETPDGTIVTDDKARVGKWGACWNRYYKLSITYYMSNLSKTVLGTLNDKFSWQKNLIPSSSGGAGMCFSLTCIHFYYFAQ